MTIQELPLTDILIIIGLTAGGVALVIAIVSMMGDDE